MWLAQLNTHGVIVPRGADDANGSVLLRAESSTMFRQSRPSPKRIGERFAPRSDNLATRTVEHSAALHSAGDGQLVKEDCAISDFISIQLFAFESADRRSVHARTVGRGMSIDSRRQSLALPIAAVLVRR